MNRIAIACTNPCHLFDLARELHHRKLLTRYYSGYPGWRLDTPAQFPLRAHSWRTLITYSLLRLPTRLGPNPASLFRWQDTGFDRAVSRSLEPADIIHGLPGQCLQTFRAAKRTGITTVLNHATAPVRQWLKIMRPEYQRYGLNVAEVTPYDDTWIERSDAETALADYHCVASEIVRQQLTAEGIPEQRIMVCPYGANTRLFHKLGTRRPKQFRIIFAGQFGIRKGIATLFQALTLCAQPGWQLDVFGKVLPEATNLLAKYHHKANVQFHGPVSQQQLAAEFRNASVLVLPSIEEAFGLVVPQAMACGLPCIVSSTVGAADIISHRSTGSIFQVHDAQALAEEFHWWDQHPDVIDYDASWTKIATQFIEASQAMLKT